MIWLYIYRGRDVCAAEDNHIVWCPRKGYWKDHEIEWLERNLHPVYPDLKKRALAPEELALMIIGGQK